MRKYRNGAIVALLACLPGISSAADPTGVTSFSKQIPGTDRRTATASATFADKIYFEFIINAEDGEYPLQVNIYDGGGREVLASQATLVIKNGRGGGATSYQFNRSRDATGTWWYVVAVDDKVVVSDSIVVDR